MSPPGPASPTSTRVVFVPISTQAQTIRATGGCHDGPVTQTAAIEVEGLRKVYDGHEAVRGINFTVRSGEVFGLLGPNGAGKTTTVEILEGYRGAHGRRRCRCSGTTRASGRRTCASGSASSSRAAAPIRT